MFVHQDQLIVARIERGHCPDTKSVEACITADQLRLASACKHTRIARWLVLSERFHACAYGCGTLNPQDICWAQGCECGRLPCNGSASC